MTSRRFAVVEVEHSTEPPAPVYWRIIRSNSRVTVDQFVAEALMISFSVVMVRVFGHRATQRRLPDEDHPIQAFVLDRANKSLRICIGESSQLRRLATIRADVSGYAIRIIPCSASNLNWCFAPRTGVR